MKYGGFCFCLLWALALAARRSKKPTQVEEYNFHIYRMQCSGDNTTSKDLLCSLKPRRRAISLMSFGLTLIKPAYQVWVQIAIHQKYNSNRYGMILYHKPENYCAFYASGAKGNIVMALVLPFFANFSVVHGCPYLPGRHELLDYEFDARMIPTLLPSASYRVDVRLSNEFNETVYYTETFSQVGALNSLLLTDLDVNKHNGVGD